MVEVGMTDGEFAAGRSGLTRRTALRFGAVAAGALAVGSVYDATAAASVRARRSARIGQSFDSGWLFHRGASAGAHDVAFDDIGWRPLDLPHDWSIEDLPGGSDDGGATANPSHTIFQTDQETIQNAPARIGPFDKDESPGGRLTAYTIGGEGWYRKRFEVENLGPDQRAELRFDGVFCRSDVWLNGKHLGFHPYGYSVFAFDLTPHLRRDGENVLAIRVNNAGQTSRWYSGSGIYRHTWLTVTPPLHIPLWGVAITTPEVDAAESLVLTRVRVAHTGQDPARASVRITIADPRGRTVARGEATRRTIRPGTEQSFAVSLPVRNPDLWSPESPSLYRAHTEVLLNGKVIDSVTETFGIRSVVMNDKDGFLLNGRPVEMRGVNIHHDHGPLGAMALNRSEERRVATLREAGFNSIRMSHNPPSPALLDICDRIGMLVYDEFTDVWDQTKTLDDYGNHFAEWWKRDAISWVMTGHNHPSVVIRSIGNEIGFAGIPVPGSGSSDTAARGQEIAAFVRSLDPTRPLCQGGAQGIWRVPSTSDRSDADAYTDVGDIHYQHDYGGKPAANPGKAWIQSESYAATIYDDWKLVAANKFAIGDFIWTGWDYLGESGIGVPQLVPIGTGEVVAPTDTPYELTQVVGGTGPYPWHGAGCGDFDLIGQPKPQLRYRQVVWGDSPIEMAVERPAPPGMEQRAVGWGWFDELESWTWDVPAGQSMKVRAYSSGDQVKLLLDGREVGSATLSEADKRIASFTVGYAHGELTAVAYRSGKEIGRKTLTTVGKPVALRLASEETSLTTSRDALAHVLVEVVDAQGRLVPDAVVKVSFEVIGGSLAAVGNGNSHNVDSFQRPRRHTYQGRAMAFVRPRKNPGLLTVKASATGLASHVLQLEVRSE
jgi:beta-galactosidase